MKKLHIVHIISTLQQGGAERLLTDLLTTWKQENPNIRHSVIVFSTGLYQTKLEQQGITVYHIPRTYLFPLFIYRLHTTMKPLQPDIIHSSLWSANFYSRIIAPVLKVPLVCSMHALLEHEGRLRTFLQKLVPQPSGGYISVSPSIAHSLTKNLLIAPACITTITNGSFPVPINLKKHTELFTFGAVGRLVPVKNFDLLIISFAEIHSKYPHTRLMLLGSGPELPKLTRLIQSYNLEHVVSCIPNKDARNYYQFFDCFVQPSSYEGLSLALLEALSAQLPVIVSGTHANHDVITHMHDGMVIKPTQEELTKNLEIMTQETDLRKKLACNGYFTWQANYTISKTCKQYHNLFTKKIFG